MACRSPELGSEATADVRARLRRFTEELLDRYVSDSVLRGHCRHFLRQKGAVLNEGPVVGIGYGAFLVFRAVKGTDLDRLVPPAAGLEMLNMSIELLDKVTDDEPPIGEGIWTEALVAAVASILQSLSTLAVRELQGVSQRTKMAYLRLLGRTNITILAGGNLDILLAEKDDATVRDSLTLAVSKSRALGDCMGRIGAMAAVAPRPVVEACARFGGHALTVAALVNDLHDARPGSENKSDIRLKRKTAPVTFLLTRTPPDKYREAKSFMHKDGPLTPTEEAVVRLAIEESGAVQFTATLADVFRYRARAALQRVKGEVDEDLLCRGLLKWQE